MGSRSGLRGAYIPPDLKLDRPPSTQPETHANVQLLDPAAYRRALEAAQCGVRATLLLPVFTSSARSSCVAVLEVVQTQGMQFELLALVLSAVLEVRGGTPSGMLGIMGHCGICA
jgi:hypothetical protein